MRYVTAFAIVACLASTGSLVSAEVPADVEGYRQGVGSPWLDIGIRRVPEGKADTVVVYSATWCPPCKVMQPVWKQLRDQGYKVVYLDIDDPHKLDDKYDYVTPELVDELMKSKPRTVPTVRLLNSETDEVVNEYVGVTSTQRIREKLWKASSSTDSRPGPWL